jgi:hypothetical protein
VLLPSQALSMESKTFSDGAGARTTAPFSVAAAGDLLVRVRLGRRPDEPVVETEPSPSPAAA